MGNQMQATGKDIRKDMWPYADKLVTANKQSCSQEVALYVA
jgi:hypothetical protein